MFQRDCKTKRIWSEKLPPLRENRRECLLKDVAEKDRKAQSDASEVYDIKQVVHSRMRAWIFRVSTTESSNRRSKFRSSVRIQIGYSGFVEGIGAR